MDKFVGTFAVYWRQPREATPWGLEFAALLTQAAAIITLHTGGGVLAGRRGAAASHEQLSRFNRRRSGENCG